MQQTRVLRVLAAGLVACPLLITACSALLGPHDFVFAQCAADADCTAPHACSAKGTCYCPNQGFSRPPASHVYHTGKSPISVAVGDLNDDGKLDLAVANHDDGTVSVLLGKADGTFEPQLTYLAGKSPQSVVVADLNGDGKPDLALANLASCSAMNSGAVSVLLNNGDGTFPMDGGKIYDFTSLATNSFALADLNDDGKPDLVVAGRHILCGGDNTVSVLLNNGDGTFPMDEGTTYSKGMAPMSVAVADLNGDGKPDLAVANVAGNTVSVLLNNGDGNFPMDGWKSSSTGSYPLSVVAADLNDDGRPDLAVVNNLDNTVSVLLGKGDGTFLDQVHYKTGLSPLSVAAVDLNDDGKSDLAVVNSTDSTVSVLLGKGDGTFADQITYKTGLSPSSVAAVDLNHGTPDLVIANQGDDTVSVLLNKGDGTFPPQPGAYPTGTAPSSVATADLDGDGKPDLAVTNFGSSTVSVLRNNGDGTFAPTHDYLVGSDSTSVAAADLNGDGKPDLAVGQLGNTVIVLLNNGDGTFPMDGGRSYPTGTNPSSVAAADLNGDGKLDLIVANSYQKPNALSGGTVSVLLNEGPGTFPVKHDYHVGGSPSSVVVADLNGDGLPDLAVANKADGTVSVLLGKGDGTFEPQVTYGTFESMITHAGLGPVSIAVADLNGDGKPDLAVANGPLPSFPPGDGTVSVLVNMGDGTFAPTVEYPAGGSPSSVAALDLNGDGLPDLAVANSADGTVSELLGNGDGTFAAKVDFPAGAGPASIAAADLNGDDAPDLAIATKADGTVTVLLNTCSP